MATRSRSLIPALQSERRPSCRGGAGAQSTCHRHECQHRRWRQPLWWVLLAVTVARPAGALGDDDVVSRIYRERATKDSLLRHDADTPLRPDDVARFQGLRYFPVDLAWRLPGELHRYGRVRTIFLPDTGGSTIEVQRYGRFVFEYRGKPFWLEVYRNLQDGKLAVYFTDATNGSQTYGAGRYVPVSRAEDGTYLIDFNEAYNPYCAYNENYICPLPPKHNHLSFAVTAGEMQVGPDLAHP